MSQPQNIQWFPGHMAKTRRMIMEKLPIVDVVAEIIDARIPLSSRNPQLSQWIKNKPRIILLNKCDMADDAATKQWINHLNNETEVVLPIDCKSGKGLNRFLPSVKTILQSKLDALKAKGMGGRTLSVMVVGIPNVGKSSFINRLAGKNAAKVENRPGVTRGNQWFKVGSGVELMDTPGVLWPKFEDEKVGEHLAFCGSIKDTVLDIESLAVRLLDILKKMYPRQLSDRYKLDFDVSAVDSFELLNEIGSRRGMKLSGSEVDTLRAATMLLEEFRNCKIGRFTIERP